MSFLSLLVPSYPVHFLQVPPVADTRYIGILYIYHRLATVVFVIKIRLPISQLSVKQDHK